MSNINFRFTIESMVNVKVHPEKFFGFQAGTSALLIKKCTMGVSDKAPYLVLVNKHFPNGNWEEYTEYFSREDLIKMMSHTTVRKFKMLEGSNLIEETSHTADEAWNVH